MVYTCNCGKTYKILKSYNNHIQKCTILSQNSQDIDYKKLYEKLLIANKKLTEENNNYKETNKMLRETIKFLENTSDELLVKITNLNQEITELNSTKNNIITTNTTNNNNNVNIQVYISLDKKPINPINFKQIIQDLTANTTKILEDYKYNKVVKFEHPQSDMYFLKEKP